MKHVCFSSILAAVLFNYANCQSGDKYLFTATPIENFPVDDEYGKLSIVTIPQIIKIERVVTFEDFFIST